MRQLSAFAIILLLPINGIVALRAPADAPLPLTSRIDELLEAEWTKQSVAPASLCTDGAFLRQASLAPCGATCFARLVRIYSGGWGPGKRSRLIDRLPTSSAHFTHFANLWCVRIDTDEGEATLQDELTTMHAWLRGHFGDNLRFDRVVLELLMVVDAEPSPVVFYTSRQVPRERLAADTATILLVPQIQCSRYHDSPYGCCDHIMCWGGTLLFSALEQRLPANQKRLPRLHEREPGEAPLPDMEQIVAPCRPGGQQLPSGYTGPRCEQLIAWPECCGNPCLRRVIANRVWDPMFARSLVESVAELGPGNPSNCVGLLDEWAHSFVNRGRDLRVVYQGIANSKACQLSSRVGNNAPAFESFARRTVKPMVAERMCNSLCRIVIRASSDEDYRRRSIQPLADQKRGPYVAAMSVAGRSRAEYRTGILQTLRLLNGPGPAEFASPGQGGELLALAAPLFTDRQRIETFFFYATLGLAPTGTEMDAWAAVLDSCESDADRGVAFGDIL